MATAEEQARTETLVTGADAVVESLVRHDVEVLFAYPGGCSMPLHQSLTRYGDRIRTILPRHEQGGAFAAQGYARTTGRPGVCMATSGPGALNLVTAIADAKLDSIPLIALTGQVPTAVIGTDAFQETPIVEVCRGITKHHFLVTRAEDIPRIVKEAFHIATTGRPGPVLIDLPKDVQQAHIVPDYDVPMNLPGYHPEVRRAHPEQVSVVQQLPTDWLLYEEMTRTHLLAHVKKRHSGAREERELVARTAEAVEQLVERTAPLVDRVAAAALDVLDHDLVPVKAIEDRHSDL